MTVPSVCAVLSHAQEAPRGTAAEEIGAGRRQAQLSAAHAAGAHAFICELPEGYDTPIGTGGVTLSPSQLLRLTIAGMLVSDPPTVLLDNPTADLDAAGEAAVLPGLETFLRGREVVVRSASPAVSTVVARAAAHDAGRDPTDARGFHPPAPATSRLRPDPSLPGLRQLLDAHRMAPLLGRTLDYGAIPDVRVISVRYKPGDNVVVQYSVSTVDGWSTAVAYAKDLSKLDSKPDRARNRKLIRRVKARTAAREPLGYLPEVSALVQWLPLDVRLPLLSEPGSRLSRRLAKRGLTPAGDGEEPELLRYWPRRRAVIRHGPHVMKVYRDAADFAEARLGLRASRGLRRTRTAPFEAAIRAQRVTVQGFVSGHALSLWPRASEAAGCMVADLHADTVLPLATTTADDILDKSAVRAAFVAHLLPELRGELESLLSELKARVPSGLPEVTSHGNFHAGQLLAAPEGITLIDLDRLCLAAPAYDLASFAAHVAFGQHGEMELVTATLESVLVGYRGRPQALGWFLANCLLRRAPVAFRHQHEHWPEAVASLVASARQALT